MRSIYPPSLAVAVLLASSAATASAATVMLGNSGLRVISNTGVSDATAGVSGLGAGVSFDLTITPTGYTATPLIGSQGGGIGVQGGKANAGLDNNFNNSGGTSLVPVETLTFSISNVTGATAINITEVRIRFGADAGADTEFYSIDGGAVQSLASNDDTIAIGPTTSFMIGARDSDGSGSDSRYAIQALTVEVTPIPEPSAGLLALIAAGFGVIRRRRS